VKNALPTGQSTIEMDGSNFRSEWSDWFDREAYDDFGAETRGMEELGMHGYSQGAMGAGEG
jgi:hypothetical protein